MPPFWTWINLRTRLLRQAGTGTAANHRAHHPAFASVKPGAGLYYLIVPVAGLVVFNPWLMVLLFVAVLPAFLGEAYFNDKSYALNRRQTPERRELDYIRYVEQATKQRRK
jgi:hypothetical protein